MSDKASLLLEHYHKAVDRLQRDFKWRGQIGFGLLLVVLILLFRAQTPDLVESWVERLVEDRAGGLPEGEQLDFGFLTSVAWLALSSLLILYFRWSLIIEFRAVYIRRLEHRLTAAADGEVATELSDLRQNRPLFFRLGQHLYTLVMLVLLFTACLLILKWEYERIGDMGLYFAIDLGIFLLMVVLSGVFAYDLWTRARRRSR